MVTIIVPTYNGAKFLQKYSIPSLLLQDYTNWEAIVINDGSSDNTAEVMNYFINKDKRIKFIDNKQNHGLAASLNQGVELSSGDIVMILEHDDIYLSNKISKQVDLINKGGVVCGCNAIVYNTENKNFTKINGGNLSCLAIKREALSFIFPLPEEDNKYLGIEDGIISARLAIAKAQNKLLDASYTQVDEILTIMNSSSKTLSGVKNAEIMFKRYDNILKLYAIDKENYPKISNLIKFWKKHRFYNKLLLLTPVFIRKIIYFIVDKQKNIKTSKELKNYSIKNQTKYSKLKEYRESFN